MKQSIYLFTLFISLFFIIGGCNNGNNRMMSANSGIKDVCPSTNLSIEVCDPETGPFSLIIDNGFFPLVVGSQSVLEGIEDDGTEIRIEINVLNETELVAGVETSVVEEVEFEDGELVEISRNFFAQAPGGAVCYFGEDVDDFEDGEVVSNEGAWRAEENGNVPGIIMPANPQVGDVFMQEGAFGLAEDQAEVIALGETINVPAGNFNDTLTTEDCNPLEDGATDEKVYIRGIGLAIDEVAELISF